MFDRTIKLIGEEKLNLIKKTSVLIVGLGGVGASCLLSLVRSGIENIVIVDYDKIDVSNLNRQLITFNSNVGEYKTDAASKIIKDINSKCKIKKYNLFLNEDNIDIIFNENKIDYIIDACDSVNTKKILIEYSIKHNIDIISCMGTGNKLDPLKLEIVDIRKTYNDPLAKVMRKWVKDKGFKHKIMVVSSREVPLKKDREISSMSFVPNTAGILLANFVIKKIINM